MSSGGEDTNDTVALKSVMGIFDQICVQQKIICSSEASNEKKEEPSQNHSAVIMSERGGGGRTGSGVTGRGWALAVRAAG